MILGGSSVSQNTLFPPSTEKKNVALLYQLSCSFEHELNCLRSVR